MSTGLVLKGCINSHVAVRSNTPGRMCSPVSGPLTYGAPEDWVSGPAVTKSDCTSKFLGMASWMACNVHLQRYLNFLSHHSIRTVLKRMVARGTTCVAALKTRSHELLWSSCMGNAALDMKL